MDSGISYKKEILKIVLKMYMFGKTSGGLRFRYDFLDAPRISNKRKFKKKSIFDIL